MNQEENNQIEKEEIANLIWPSSFKPEVLKKHMIDINQYTEALKKIDKGRDICSKCQDQDLGHVLDHAGNIRDILQLIYNLTDVENHRKFRLQHVVTPTKNKMESSGSKSDIIGETSGANGNQQKRTKHKEETANKEQEKKLKRSETNGKESEDLRKRCESVEKEATQLSEKCQKVLEEKTKLEKEVQRLSEKLSDRMSEQVASNEKHIENVSIKNRPMNIADEYLQLRGENWLNVKSLLDEKIAEKRANIPEEDMEEFKFRCLCTLLIKAEACSKAKYNEMIVRVFLSFTAEVNIGAAKQDRIAGNAIVQMATDNRNQKWTEENVNQFLKNIPESLKLCVSDMLRVAADEADISAITQEICEAITQKQASSDQSNKVVDMYMEIINDKVFEKYIEECARLTWKMILQRPPMKFDVSDEGEPFKGEKIQDIWFSSDNVKNKNAIVRCYVHPALYHEENPMAKGVVYINLPKKV